MAAQNVVVSRRIADIEMSDVRLMTNDTGRTLYHNEVITVGTGTNKGYVGVVDAGSVGGTVAASAQYSLIIKGIVSIVKAAVAFTQGCDVQYAASAAAATTGGTATGLYGVGMCVEAVASGDSFVKVDLNFGPTAFYVW